MNEYIICGMLYSFRSRLADDISDLVQFIYNIEHIDTKEDAYIILKEMRAKIRHIEAEIKKPGTAYMLEDAP